MKLSHQLVIQSVGDFYLAVPVGSLEQGSVNYIQINVSCRLIIECLMAGMDVPQIVQEYKGFFALDEDLARHDVNYTIDMLRQMGLVQD